MATAVEIESGSLDQAVSDLAVGSARWSRLSIADRAALLRAAHATTAAQAATWAKVACEAKHVPAGTLEGEEWISGRSATLQAAPISRDADDQRRRRHSCQSATTGGNPRITQWDSLSRIAHTTP